MLRHLLELVLGIGLVAGILALGWPGSGPFTAASLEPAASVKPSRGVVWYGAAPGG